MTHTDTASKTNGQTVFKSSAGAGEIMRLYEAKLAEWPVAQETQMVSTRHGDTFVIVSGERGADPLILLHGAGTNSTMWIGEVQAYSQHYRVYAVDIIGEAGKSAANRPAWEGPAYEEWLTDVLDGLDITKATIIGISQGSWVALKLATVQPERVEKLVLISPGGIIPDKMMFVFKVLPLMMLGSWGIQRVVKMLYAEQPIPEGVTEVMTVMMKHFKPRVGVLPLFSDDALASLTMPTLLLAGTKDALRDSEKIAERLPQWLPSLSVHLVEGGGHALNDMSSLTLSFLLA